MAPVAVDPALGEPAAADLAIGPGPDATAAGARPPGRLQSLAETARDYAKASAAENTRRAYGSDWRHFSGWARRHGLPALPPDPQILGLYVAACASGAITGKPDSVATLERRIRRCGGISHSAAKNSTAPTATSPPSSPASAAPRDGRRSRKKPSCPRISWR